MRMRLKKNLQLTLITIPVVPANVFNPYNFILYFNLLVLSVVNVKIPAKAWGQVLFARVPHSWPAELIPLILIAEGFQL